MVNHNSAPGKEEKKDYIPPIQLFGKEGVFSEYTGEELAKFGDYGILSLNEAVRICGQYWVPNILKDPVQGRAFFKSVLVGK